MFCACLCAAHPAAAQSLSPGPPGPFVLDVRGVSSGLPSGASLLQPLPAGVTVPGRGLGGSAGAHVYALRIGPARLGMGVDVMLARGSTAAARSRLTTVAPQLSANFGTSDGWSYLSAGVGTARQRFDPGGVSDSVRAVNVGGGARWFLRAHVGIGFDVRIHRLAAGDAAPAATMVAAAVGLSMK